MKLLHKSIERKNGDVQHESASLLAKVGDGDGARVEVGLCERSEGEGAWLFDLCAPAEGLVGREGRRVPDGELLVAQDVDATGRTVVQLHHSSDVRKRHKVAVFEGMAIICDRHQTLFVLRERRGERDT